ncbi:MAG TPA: Sapep family Mn(2+)-dependent dipeptidase, partial [Massilibacterium sp.]|nr:Sapep family Mn(2+)-dependent dipeptidase [Massilibacterium sp.]
GDEESDWRCVQHYFKHEEMPVMGFAPDADFPIIHAEKGISDVMYQQKVNSMERVDYTLQTFSSGVRLNMVPDEAKAVVSGEHVAILFEKFSSFLKEHPISGHAELENDKVTLFVKGESAHAMEPNNGKNAGLYLVHFLSVFSFDHHAKHFLTFLDDYFFLDSRGKKAGVQMKDDISGDLTVNVGVIRFSDQTGGKFGVNLRYPVTKKSDALHQNLETLAQKNGFSYIVKEDSKPHYVEEKHPLIQTLQKVYEKQTGKKGELLSIGGGTYARALDAGVAFGPLFPGRNEVAHQKDEYVYIDDLLLAIAIYAEAIYELAK